MKRLLLGIVIAVAGLLIQGPSVGAQTVGAVTPSTPAAPVLTTSPLLITALQYGADRVHFVELHNTTNTVVALKDWRVVLVANETEFLLATLDGWLPARDYMVLAYDSMVAGADIQYVLAPEVLAELAGATENRALELLPPDQSNIAKHEITATHGANEWLRRTKNANGNYGQTFTAVSATDSAQPITLTGGGLYMPPDDSAGLRIVEVLPNARNCSPVETAIECGDYIKLLNASTAAVDLSAYRLRSDSGGKNSTASNTFALSGVVAPGAYHMVSLRSNGELLSLTNTGGFVWLEDELGVMIYEPVAAYPDASAASKKGLSWAFDDAAAEWRWMPPAPHKANYWPPEPPPAQKPKTVFADCGPGRERNPATNRCRNIASATTTLVPCRVGQERNPATNRCRSVLAASTALKPCAAGQYRNPETNRCKKIESASASLVPCREGHERNPETNRCRKVTTAAAANVPNVKDVDMGEQASVAGWWVAGGAVLAATAYGVYEWRQDIWRRLRRFVPSRGR